MNKRDIRRIVFIIIIIIILLVIKVNRGKKVKEYSENPQVISASKKVSEKQDNSSVPNSSEKLNETKYFGEFEMTDVFIAEQNGLATLTASIKNTSNKTIDEFPFSINVLNKNGEKIGVFKAYLGMTEPDQIRGINASTNMDISQIYDLEIEF